MRVFHLKDWIKDLFGKVISKTADMLGNVIIPIVAKPHTARLGIILLAGKTVTVQKAITPRIAKTAAAQICRFRGARILSQL